MCIICILYELFTFQVLSLSLSLCIYFNIRKRLETGGSVHARLIIPLYCSDRIILSFYPVTFFLSPSFSLSVLAILYYCIRFLVLTGAGNENRRYSSSNLCLLFLLKPWKQYSTNQYLMFFTHVYTSRAVFLMESCYICAL